MGALTYKVTGFDKLEAGLDALVLGLNARAREAAALNGAERILARMQELVPVDQGDLREGLAITPGEKPESLRIGPTGRTAWRAHFTEFGTQHHPAQSFIRAAFETEQATVRKGVAADLSASITQQVRRAR